MFTPQKKKEKKALYDSLTSGSIILIISSFSLYFLISIEKKKAFQSEKKKIKKVSLCLPSPQGKALFSNFDELASHLARDAISLLK